MATNFTMLYSNKQEPKKTVFKKLVTGSFEIEDSSYTPNSFKNVFYIGNDKYYGDVFKAWDDDENDFLIFFGTAGDEFKK